MIYDKIDVTCSHKAVKEAQAQLELVRSLLRTSQQHLRIAGGHDLAVTTLYQADSKIARSLGILDAVEGWLAPVKEGDDL